MASRLALLFLILTFPVRADFRSDLEGRSLLYFLENQSPVTGLVLDRARNSGRAIRKGRYRLASIASTGFGLAVIANAAKRGIIDRTEAEARLVGVMEFALERAPHHAGWLYHFMDWETGERAIQSEVSTIDTALFLAGALYAGTVFPSVEKLARQFYDRLDFKAMVSAVDYTLTMGWIPESGYLPWRWDSYAEHLILILLGLGHPLSPLPIESWGAWKRPILTMESGEKLIGPELPLFAHQYSHLFVDFRSYPTLEKFFRNSRLATKRDRLTCTTNAPLYLTYSEGFWGLSASGSMAGYKAFSPVSHNGTVCPSCAGASLPFAPDTFVDLQKWAKSIWAPRIWGRYGFVDSVSLDENWFDPDVIGITLGALYLALNDLSPAFQQVPEIRRGLERAAAAELFLE